MRRFAVGETVFWARTQVATERSRSGSWQMRMDHDIAEGRVISTDDVTTAVWAFDNRMVFLPVTSAYPNRELADTCCRRRNLAMFGHELGRFPGVGIELQDNPDVASQDPQVD